MSRQAAAKAAASPRPSRASPCRCAAVHAGFELASRKFKTPAQRAFPWRTCHRVPRRFTRTTGSDQANEPAQYPSGSPTTGVHRFRLTTDRNDCVEAWWSLDVMVSGGPPKMSRQSRMPSIDFCNVSTFNSRPARCITSRRHCALHTLPRPDS